MFIKFAQGWYKFQFKHVILDLHHKFDIRQILSWNSFKGVAYFARQYSLIFIIKRC